MAKLLSKIHIITCVAGHSSLKKPGQSRVSFTGYELLTIVDVKGKIV